MHTHRRNAEKGQAIILLAVGAVVMLGFAALAIDGGMVYANQRHAQNAADAASLAGALNASQIMEANAIYYDNFDCSTISSVFTAAQTGAITSAGSNDYTIDVDVSDKHGVEITCVDDDVSNGYLDKYIDIRTVITRDTDTSLIHFVYSGPVVGTVEATARVRPRIVLAYGHAVVALNDETACDNNSKEGVVFSGSGQTSINGGGVWSNGCLKGVNNSCQVAVTDGNIAYAGGRYPSSGAMCASMSPSATSASSTLPPNSYDVPAPDCSASGAITIDSIDKQYLNANTTDNTLQSNTLYCLTSSGDAVKITNGELYGEGVTIYLKNSGDININGGTIDLAAPTSTSPPSSAMQGILFYVDPGSSSTITLNGNNDSSYLGVIYAPEADVNISGAQDTYPTFNTQIIGKNIEISGNASVDINFDDQETYTVPPKLDMAK